MQDSFLEIKNISKTFPGMRALDNVSLSVAQGEIHAVCGETGAGKSTLIRVLSGAIPFGSYSGEFSFEGNPCRFRNIRESEARSIAVIRQHSDSALIPTLSIAENVMLDTTRNSLRVVNWNRAYKTASARLKRVGFKGSLSEPASTLSPSEQQLVSLANALSKNAKLLILDEPTASLDSMQASSLFNLLNSLRTYEGTTILLVSHNIRDVAKVADKITVLRDGQVISTFERNTARTGGEADSGYNEEGIIKAMVGRSLAERFPKRKRAPGDILIEIRDWTVHDFSSSGRKVCDGVNVTVREGEVVGIAGLIGSGRSEFARSIFGKSYGANISGSIFMRGRQIQVNTVRSAIAHHFAYISEPLQGRNLFANDTISKNITIANLPSISTLLILRRGKEHAEAEKYRKELGIRCLSVEQNVNTLSAGSRQKVLFGKWLFTNPDFLIMDEPAGGVDVGSKYDFYSTVNSLVEQGKGVLLITAEVSEMLGMCDRIYVMSSGRIVGELSREEASLDAIMDCILQAERNSKEAV